MAHSALEYTDNFPFDNYEVLASSNRSVWDPKHSFKFEKFDMQEVDASLMWFQNNWTKSIVYSALYAVLIYFGRIYMENRPRFDLRLSLVIWSFSLAVFSWIGAIRVWVYTIDFIRAYGWKASVCDPTLYKGVVGFWSWLFVLSKLPELGDTVFIVLRKQKLIFLHWYHHITVLIYSWYTYPQLVAPSRYFVLMNFTVHSLMYTYYALKASKWVNIPTWVNIVITSLQIAQMFVGCFVNGYAYSIRSNGGFCATTDANLRASFLMYLSYFVLFVHFFIETYVTSKRKQRALAEKSQAQNILQDSNDNTKSEKKIN
ncbi:elongation of very long chain fatty acids protein 6-like [Acanthaster planci]|uniref:Elongation of very long chain fatty acids protein n=1 Tax=Acanthaster planci TaxID=133434 RepID=A0A8B8A1Q6_ACAPL|nr:elongation of very long chain fatty acids protein 6-like [Acanthaster planci]